MNRELQTLGKVANNAVEAGYVSQESMFVILIAAFVFVGMYAWNTQKNIKKLQGEGIGKKYKDLEDKFERSRDDTRQRLVTTIREINAVCDSEKSKLSMLEGEVKVLREDNLRFKFKHDSHEKHINNLFEMVRETQKQVIDINTTVRVMNQDVSTVKDSVQDIHDLLMKKG